MFRTTLLALAASTGLLGSTEILGTTAKADTIIRIGVGGKGGGVVVGGVLRPAVYRPVYTPTTVYYSAPPVIVTPVYVNYDVFYRANPASPWLLLGTFNSRSQVYDATVDLRLRGFEVFEVQR